MAAIQLIDFEDIYSAVLELLKIQSSDTTTLNRIKRDINIIYADVVSRQNWWWNRSVTTVATKPKITTGTVSATLNSTSITLSSAPAASVLGYKIKIQGRKEVFTIAAHTGGSTSATLNIAWNYASVSGQTYVLWKDFTELPTDCKETFIVQHQNDSQPMIATDMAKFRQITAQLPDKSGFPVYYTTDDFDSSDQRRLRFFPAVTDNAVNIDVDYIMNFVGLDVAGDEPIIPISDRMVLFYGAAWMAWDRQRNEEAANKYLQLYEKKLSEMASNLQDSFSGPTLKASRGYLAAKRRQRRRRYSD